MTDHEHSLIRAVLGERTRDRFSPDFTDRLLARIATEEGAPAPLFVQLWPQFRRLAIGAAAASLVMAVYTMNGAETAPGQDMGIEQIYGLEALQP